MADASNMTRPRDFLGVGWQFPFDLRPKGSVATARHGDDIMQSIAIIIETNPGERLMRPNFGAGLRSFLFEPVNTSTLELVRQRVEDSLIDWERRIDLERVSVIPGEQRNLLLIEVDYRVRANNARGNLVYPFYLDEGPTT
ncbi:MAG: GPW/gp25 family protein [Planctomycetota bacterium]